MKHYIIMIVGGCDVWQSEPFATREERDAEAKRVWAHCDKYDGDNVFWADVDAAGNLNIATYLDGDLDYA